MAKAKPTTQLTVTLQRRPATGTRPVKRLRQEGLVPGVVYGKEMEPVAVSVHQEDLIRLLRSKQGEHALVTLRLDGTSAWEKPALVKVLQHDPVDGHVLHIDFHAIVLTQRLKVHVPLILKGEPIGVKQEGGVLEHFLREIEVECLPTEIPAGVEFNISALTVGQTLHVRDLTPPHNARITSDPAGVIASIQTPKEEKPEEAAAAVTEPEVIREKKEEAEAPTGEAAKSESSVRSGTSESRAGETAAKKEAKPEK